MCGAVAMVPENFGQCDFPLFHMTAIGVWYVHPQWVSAGNHTGSCW